MDIKNENQNSINSILKMEHIIFDSISFARKGFRDNNSTSVDIKAQKKIEKDGNGRYRVILKVSAEKNNEYNAEIQITGYCAIDENYPQKDVLLNENAIAILFPYIRAELSLLTAQPEVEPIVLPAMNISAMFK